MERSDRGRTPLRIQNRGRVAIEGDENARQSTLARLGYGCPDDLPVPQVDPVERSYAANGLRPLGDHQLDAEVNVHEAEFTWAELRLQPELTGPQLVPCEELESSSCSACPPNYFFALMVPAPFTTLST